MIIALVTEAPHNQALKSGDFSYITNTKPVDNDSLLEDLQQATLIESHRWLRDSSQAQCHTSSANLENPLYQYTGLRTEKSKQNLLFRHFQ